MESFRFRVRALLFLLPAVAAMGLTPIAGPNRVLAQELDTRSLVLFDRVRVWAPQAGLVGQEGAFHGWDRGRFLLATSGPQGAKERLLPTGEITRLEVQRLTGNRWVTGFATGGGLGLASGGVFTLACGDACDGLSTFVAVGGFGFGVGAASGALIGLMIPEKEWLSVSVGPPSQSSTSGESRANGGAVQFRVRLSR